MRKFFILFICIISLSMSTMANRMGSLRENYNSDTVWVWTDRNEFLGREIRGYVIDGVKEMVVYRSETKTDTTIYNEISDETKYKYRAIMETRRIRSLPIEKVDADQAMDLFPLGETK